MNSEEDTTADDWEGYLYPSFTQEVSVDELVDLFNQNLRPAQQVEKGLLLSFAQRPKTPQD